jgi:protein-disulfide isomerase/uncharacterized membrane protein
MLMRISCLSLRRFRIAAIVTCVLGGLLSMTLLRAHLNPTADGVLAQVCGGAGSGCDAVINSRWGYFPPLALNASPGGHQSTSEAVETVPSEAMDRGRLPVAALGLFYFSAVLVGLTAIGFSAEPQRWMYLLSLTVVVLGCLASLAYVALMGLQLGNWCLLCLAVHACNFALLVLVVALFRRTNHAAADSPSGERRRERNRKASAAHAGPVRHSSSSSAVPALLLIAAVLAAEYYWYRAARAAQQYESAAADLHQLWRSGETVELAFFQQQKQEIEIRDDDPFIPASPGLRMTLVVFSDIECGYCAGYHRYLHDVVQPMFNGHLRLVFKHRPHVNLHPNARRAAQAAEAARRQGKFWEMYNLLLDHRAGLARADYAQFATELELNVPQFLADLDSDAVNARIDEDIAQAEKLRVSAVPTVFLNGRRLDRSSRSLTGFWRLRADSLKRTRLTSRQGW